MKENSIHQVIEIYGTLTDDEKEVMGDAAERFMDEVCSSLLVMNSLPSMLPFLLGWVATLDRQVKAGISPDDRMMN